MTDEQCPATIRYGNVTVRCERPPHADERHWTAELNWPDRCDDSAA